MARKKNEFDFGFDDESTQPVEEGPEAERLASEIYSPEFLEQHEKMIQTKHIVLREMRRADDGRILVDGDDGNFYLLPKDYIFEANRTTLLPEDDSRLERLYTWENEINAALPDRDALVRQIRRSFYLAGAFQKGDLKRNEVARNLTRSAFPYIFKEIEE